MQMFLDKLQWRQTEVGHRLRLGSPRPKLAHAGVAPLDGQNAD